MANTYTLISSNVLSSSASSVTFSSIPSTYTDLVLKISSRGSVSANQTFLVSFNGAPSGSLYSTTELIGEGSTAFSQRTNSYSSVEAYALSNDSGTTANTFNNIEVYVPSYTASQNKPISLFGVKENNSASVNVIDADAALWRSTSAITSIVIAQGGGSFVSGSSFYLYGIKNS
jgi:hypothetical protein